MVTMDMTSCYKKKSLSNLSCNINSDLEMVFFTLSIHRSSDSWCRDNQLKLTHFTLVNCYTCMKLSYTFWYIWSLSYITYIRNKVEKPWVKSTVQHTFNVLIMRSAFCRNQATTLTNCLYLKRIRVWSASSLATEMIYEEKW